jgi:hypothetical protein
MLYLLRCDGLRSIQ